MKELWLFTRQFPLGRGEAFLESALPVFREHFDRVRVIPMYEGPGRVELPEGVEELRLWEGAACFTGIPPAASLVQAPALFHLLGQRGDGWMRSIPAAHEAVSHARQLLYKTQVLRRRLLPEYDPARVTLFCTWMEDWVNVLTLLARKEPALRFSCLAHGWDLFEDRRSSGAIPYRAMQMQALEKVYCIAEHGLEHLRKRYPEQATKLQLARLGTADHGVAPWSPSPTLRLVSCAYLRAPKRMHLLAEALRHVKRPVHWTHFGDGPDAPALKAACADLPAHITVDLKGSVPNTEVLAWYRTHPVDLCVLLSGLEGVPVSLMEAASFGIPLLANDVGGVREVVHEGTGELLPADVDASTLADRLDNVVATRWCDVAARAGVRKAWLAQFSASTNYGKLARAIGGS